MSSSTQPWAVGSLVKSGDAILRVVAIKPQHNQVLLEGSLGESHVYRTEDFNNCVARGELCPLLTHSEAQAQLPDRHLTRTEKNVLDVRIGIVNEVKQLVTSGLSWGEIHGQLTAKMGALAPCLRTLQRWHERVKKSVHVEALAPNFSQRGRRSSIPDDVLVLIYQQLEQWYLSTDRFKIYQITQAINDEIRKKNEADGGSFNGVSRRAVGRFISKLALGDFDRGRLDPRTLRHVLRGAFHHLHVERPYERIELDATPLDVLIVNTAGKIVGSPTLYVAIDCATRAVLGLYLTIQAESQTALLRALESMFLPKDEAFMAKYGLERSLPAPCMFSSLVVDNASAHHGGAMRMAVQYLGGAVEFSKAKTPQQRPFVERIHMTFKTGLIDMLAGAKDSQEKLEDKALERAMREACYTLEQLEGLLFRWAANVYMDRQIDRLNFRFDERCTPRRAMQLLCEKYPVMPPPTPDAFRKACMNFNSKAVKLTREGVAHSTFTFQSDELYDLFMASPRGSKVEVRSHPLDISRVEVVDPRDHKSVIVAYNKLTALPPISFEEAKLIRQRFYMSDYELSTEDYVKSQVTLMKEIDQKNKAKKVSSRKQGARADNRRADSIAVRQQQSAPMTAPVFAETCPLPVTVTTRKKGCRS